MREPWIKKKDKWIESGREKEPASDENKPQEYGVIYHPIRCPKCQSKNVKCYTSQPPIRYHKCRFCDLNFKSFEAE